MIQELENSGKVRGDIYKALHPVLLNEHCLVGHVVKVFTPKVEGPDFKSRLQWDFSRSSHTSDLKVGTPVATLPGAWR